MTKTNVFFKAAVLLILLLIISSCQVKNHEIKEKSQVIEAPKWDIGDYWVMRTYASYPLSEEIHEEIEIFVVEGVDHLPTTAVGVTQIKSFEDLKKIQYSPNRKGYLFKDRFFDINKDVYIVKVYSPRIKNGTPSFTSKIHTSEAAFATDDLSLLFGDDVIGKNIGFFDWPLKDKKTWSRNLNFMGKKGDLGKDYQVYELITINSTGEVIQFNQSVVEIDLRNYYPAYLKEDYNFSVKYYPSKKFWTTHLKRVPLFTDTVTIKGNSSYRFGSASHALWVDSEIIYYGHTNNLDKDENGVPVFFEEMQEKVNWQPKEE